MSLIHSERQLFRAIERFIAKISTTMKTAYNRELIIVFIDKMLDKYEFPQDNSKAMVLERIKRVYAQSPPNILNEINQDIINKIEQEQSNESS